MPTQLDYIKESFEDTVEEERQREEDSFQRFKDELPTTIEKYRQERDEREHYHERFKMSLNMRDSVRYSILNPTIAEKYSQREGTEIPGPGLGGAFMQGITFGHEELFGEYGGGLEPQSVGESAASFAGALATTIPLFLASRYPFAVAFAGETASTLMSRIAVEVGGGLITDTAIVLPEDGLGNEEKAGLVMLGVVASMLMPAPLGKAIKKAITVTGEGVSIKEIARKTVERGVKEGIQSVERPVEELLPKVIRPSQLKTETARKAVDRYSMHGESAIAGINDVTEAIHDKWNGILDHEIMKVDKFLIKDKSEITKQGMHAFDENIRPIFDELGALSPRELKYTLDKLENLDLNIYPPETVLKEIRLRNSKAWAKDYKKYNDRILSDSEVDPTFISSVDPVFNKSKAIIDDAVYSLERADQNLTIGLPTYTTAKGRELYELALKEASENSNNALQNPELKDLLTDLDTFIKYIRDENLEFGVSPGFARSSEIKKLSDNLVKLGDIYANRPDLLEAQLKEMVNLAVSSTDSAERQFLNQLQILSKHRAKAEELEVAEVLRNYHSGGKVPRINTVGVYNKSKEALKEQLKSQPEYNKYDLMTFQAGDESRAAIMQMDQELEQQATMLLNDSWDKVVPILTDNVGNPSRIRQNVISTRAALGDIPAKDTILYESRQRRDVTFNAVARDSVLSDLSWGGPTKKGGPSKPVDKTGDLLKGVTPPDMDAALIRNTLGHNPASKFLGELKTNIEVFANKLKVSGDTDGAKVLNRVLRYMDEMVHSRREYLDMNQNFNDRRDALFTKWKEQNITDHVIKAVDEVSVQANKMQRDGAPLNEIETWITGYVNKQSKEVQVAYREAREFETDKFNMLVDFVHSINNKYGLSIDPPTYRPGYVHFAYDGDFLFHIKNEEGVFKIPFTSKAQLANALNELSDRGHNMDSVDFMIEPRWASDVEDFAIADSAMKDGSAFGISNKELQDMYTKTGKFKAETVLDVVWGGIEHRILGLESRKKAVVNAWAISDRLTARYVNLMEHSIKISQAVEALKESKFGELEGQVRQWANDVFGKSRNFEQDVDKHLQFIHNVIDKVPGARYVADANGLRKGARPLRVGIDMLASTGRLLSIGFNPMTALIQLTQGLTNVAPVLGAKNFYQGWRNIKKFMVAGSREAKLATKAAIFLRYSDDMGKITGLNNLRSSSGWGLQRTIKKPWAAQSGLEYTLDTIEHYSMMPFNAAENRQRLATLWAAMRDGEQKAKRILEGKKGKESTYDVIENLAEVMGKSVDDESVIDAYALKMLDKLQFDFDIPGVTALARNPLFKLPMQFKTYFFQELEFLMGRKMPLTNSERFKSLAVFLGLGGVAALPFSEDVDAITTKIFGKSPMLWLYSNAPDIVTAGFPGLVNINLSPLINAGGTRSMNLLPGFGGILTSKLWRAYEDYTKGRGNLVESILGTSTMTRNFMEAMEMWKYGGVYAPGGTTQLREGGKLAAFGESLGVSTLTNAKQHKLEWELYRIEKGNAYQRRIDKERIVKSEDPYRLGQRLGYERKLIKQWLKERKEGKTRVDTTSKEVREQVIQDYGLDQIK